MPTLANPDTELALNASVCWTEAWAPARTLALCQVSQDRPLTIPTPRCHRQTAKRNGPRGRLVLRPLGWW